MKNLGTTLATIALAGTTQLAIASETYNPEPLVLSSEQINKICKDTNQKSGLILDGVELCEVPSDEDKARKGIIIGGSAGAVLALGAIYALRRKFRPVGPVNTPEEPEDDSSGPTPSSESEIEILPLPDGFDSVDGSSPIPPEGPTLVVDDAVDSGSPIVTEAPIESTLDTVFDHIKNDERFDMEGDLIKKVKIGTIAIDLTNGWDIEHDNNTGTIIHRNGQEYVSTTLVDSKRIVNEYRMNEEEIDKDVVIDHGNGNYEEIDVTGLNTLHTPTGKIVGYDSIIFNEDGTIVTTGGIRYDKDGNEISYATSGLDSVIADLLGDDKGTPATEDVPTQELPSVPVIAPSIEETPAFDPFDLPFGEDTGSDSPLPTPVELPVAQVAPTPDLVPQTVVENVVKDTTTAPEVQSETQDPVTTPDTTEILVPASKSKLAAFTNFFSRKN